MVSRVTYAKTMRIGFHSFLCIAISALLAPYTPLFAQSIVQTEIVSIGAVVGSIPSIDTGGGGGGAYQSGVRFSGYAYPGATVTVQVRDTQLLTVRAQDSGQFSVVIPETDWQLFTLFATDTAGRRSTVLNFPTVLYSGYITDISGIRFAPTITTDKVAVKKGDFISIEGSATPQSTVALVIESQQASQQFSFIANSQGVYNATIPVTLPEGEYVLKAQYPQDSRTSRALRLTVGTASLFRVETTKNIPGDCNVDQRVTLVDFSVLAYWYGKQNPPQCVDTNKDGVITLVDFSILAFYWNG